MNLVTWRRPWTAAADMFFLVSLCMISVRIGCGWPAVPFCTADTNTSKAWEGGKE